MTTTAKKATSARIAAKSPLLNAVSIPVSNIHSLLFLLLARIVGSWGAPLGEQTADREGSEGNEGRIDYKQIEQRRTCDRDHRPNEPSASAHLSSPLCRDVASAVRPMLVVGSALVWSNVKEPYHQPELDR
jgi:hypothetical protein